MNFDGEARSARVNDHGDYSSFDDAPQRPRDINTILDQALIELRNNGEKPALQYAAIQLAAQRLYPFGDAGVEPRDLISEVALDCGLEVDEVQRRLRKGIEQAALDQRTEDPASLSGISLDDFHAYMPTHSYLYTPTRQMWPAASVNARISPILIDEKGRLKPIAAAAWLDRNKPIEQMTWTPGEPMLIRNRLISEGGWVRHKGITCFNLYRPASPQHGSAIEAGPWLDHITKIYGEDAGHIVLWLAHRVQRPQEKINHALVLGGNQGVGKDTLLEPVKQAVGPWNFFEISPQQFLGRFNGFLKSVILRISEARDLGDVDRFQFYDHSKTYLAAPPDVLRIDEKHLAEHSIINCVGVIITSNYKSDGIYLPADDRRHFVAWSAETKENFDTDYWNKLWRWYEGGGYGHVATYLATLDLSGFDPKAPPPKTPAFWDIVDANRAPEDAELADVIEDLGSPAAITIEQIGATATGSFQAWITDRKNRRQIPHRLEKCQYVQVRNDAAEDGLWKIDRKRRAVYARKEFSIRDRQAAASRLTER
jgi:hypothetical protein